MPQDVQSRNICVIFFLAANIWIRPFSEENVMFCLRRNYFVVISSRALQFLAYLQSSLLELSEDLPENHLM